MSLLLCCCGFVKDCVNGWMALTWCPPLCPSVCPCMAPRCSRGVEVSRAYQRLHTRRLDADSAAGWWHGETGKYNTHTHRSTEVEMGVWCTVREPCTHFSGRVLAMEPHKSVWGDWRQLGCLVNAHRLPSKTNTLCLCAPLQSFKSRKPVLFPWFTIGRLIYENVLTARLKAVAAGSCDVEFGLALQVWK